MWWAVLGVARAATFDELLARGPVSVVETAEDGRLEQITVYAQVDAPVQAVWDKLVGFAAYGAWMPQVDGVSVVSQTATHAEVAWSIRVPGPNFKYVAEYQLDPTAHVLVATGKSGGMSGGKWQWKLTASGGGTLIERTTYASAVIDNWILRSFDDSERSMELGINAAVPIIETRAIERALEP